MSDPAYVGRFAPTPSGPLHFGSIVAALGSHLDARARGGRWLVRIDDLDTPRVRRGAAAGILQTLEHLGMHWDGTVAYQDPNRERYEASLDRLRNGGLVYACDCPRRATKGRPYPGTCRKRALGPGPARALRVVTSAEPVLVEDRIHGTEAHLLEQEHGDFIVRRADGIHAYHLAVVVDDAALGVTHIVRGADLLESTAQQVYLQRLLALPTPVYVHLPIVMNPDGSKMSKRDDATAALLRTSPQRVLCDALAFLGQDPDPALAGEPVPEIIRWGTTHWRRERVPRAGAAG